MRLERALAAMALAVARHASGNSLSITATRNARDGTVRIAVAAGSKEDERKDDFVDAAVDEFQSGLGLTLPIARRVIDLEGGRLYAAGGGPGSCLVAELPLHA